MWHLQLYSIPIACIHLSLQGKEEDDLLGTTSMSLLRFLRKPYRASNEDMPLFYPEESRGGGADSKQQMRKLRSRVS